MSVKRFNAVMANLLFLLGCALIFIAQFAEPEYQTRALLTAIALLLGALYFQQERTP